MLLNIVAFKIYEKPFKVNSHTKLHRTVSRANAPSDVLCTYTLYPPPPTPPLPITLKHARFAILFNYIKSEPARGDESEELVRSARSCSSIRYNANPVHRKNPIKLYFRKPRQQDQSIELKTPCNPTTKSAYRYHASQIPLNPSTAFAPLDKESISANKLQKRQTHSIRWISVVLIAPVSPDVNALAMSPHSRFRYRDILSSARFSPSTDLLPPPPFSSSPPVLHSNPLQNLLFETRCHVSPQVEA